jgi:hypothetical protein
MVTARAIVPVSRMLSCFRGDAPVSACGAIATARSGSQDDSPGDFPVYRGRRLGKSSWSAVFSALINLAAAVMALK